MLIIALKLLWNVIDDKITDQAEAHLKKTALMIPKMSDVLVLLFNLS